MSEFQTIVDEAVREYLKNGNAGALNRDIDDWTDDDRSYKMDITCMVVNSLYIQSNHDLDVIRDIDFQLSPDETGTVWLYVTRLEAKHQADLYRLKRGQNSIITSSGNVRGTNTGGDSDSDDDTDGEDIVISDDEDSE